MSADSSCVSMRVAVVYPHLPHYRYGVFAELDRRISDVIFIADGASRDGTIAVIPAGSFTRQVRVRNYWVGPLLWQRGLGKALRRLKPEAVIFLGDAAYASTWVQATLSRLLRRKVYFWTIGWHRADKGPKRLVRLCFYRLADKLLLYGNRGRELGLAQGYPAERMVVIYNSYSSLTDERRHTLSDLDLPDGSRPVIGAVIRLSKNKGLEEVVRALYCLRESHGIDADGLIVGEGPERVKLEALAAELGVRLFLPGAIYDEETLADVYRRLTVTVIPRAAGLTTLQSLEAGTPVVTIKDPDQQMPEYEAIHDGVSGTLVERADGGSIAAACALWIERVAEDGDTVQVECSKAIRTRWCARAQAVSIADALRDGATDCAAEKAEK